MLSEDHLNRSPILKALSSMRKSGAQTLLMGGQACVFYGAAEFSRDLDLLILVSPDNLARVRTALAELLAQPIAVPVTQPPLSAELLMRGHAFHFRCHRPDVEGLRVDIMSVLRDVLPFDELWERRTTVDIEGELVDLVALEDLIRIKQTQTAEDWSTIRLLVERSWFALAEPPPPGEIDFILRELRTPELLNEAATRFPSAAQEVAGRRPAVEAALSGDVEQVRAALRIEQDDAIRKDRLWWEPLKRELEQFRHQR